MQAFRDSAGRVWMLPVTVDGLLRTRALAGVDLLEVLDDQADLFARLSEDVVLLIDVLFALVKPEADCRDVSDEAFGRSFSGDVLETACEALTAGIIEFFPTKADIQWPEAEEKKTEDGLRAAERAEKFLWELAGILGVHPGPFTLRDLVRMAQARQREEWGRLSHLLASVANVLAGPNDRRITPADCNPFLAKGRRTEPEGIRVGSGQLKRLFRSTRSQKDTSP